MNRFLRSAVCSFCFILLLADTSSAKAWRGIVPLRSTRTDIARLFKQLTGASLFGVGLPHDSFIILGEGKINIFYSQGRCFEWWKIKRDTVIEINVALTKPIPFADMRAELEHLPAAEEHTGVLHYINFQDGISYAVYESDIISITYHGNERDDQSLACKKAARR